jgi:transposase
MTPQIRVGIDVGRKHHCVGISSPEGVLLEEFSIPHSRRGFDDFFRRVERHRDGLPVAVAMEGHGGHARPLDKEIMERGYELFSVNNLKLARFREIFPAPAKTDELDTRLILDLFRLDEHLPPSRGSLARVCEVPEENAKLQRLSRRRRELVEEKVRTSNRMQSDLASVCPELLEITGSADNLWFLRFLTCREGLEGLVRLRPESLLKIPGVGKVYAETIRSWQKNASFSPDVSYVGPMIVEDARRILELTGRIASLEAELRELSAASEIARLLATIPGYGETSVAELAGEIGTLERFGDEASLALYLGMCPLDNSSGAYRGSKAPRQVNKQARRAMMNALSHHIKQVPQSRAFYDRKRSEGKKHNQALRSLGRHMVRVIWCILRDGRDYELR